MSTKSNGNFVIILKNGCCFLRKMTNQEASCREMLFGQRGAFTSNGSVCVCVLCGLVLVYHAKNGVRCRFVNFKQIGDRFVDSDIKIAVVVNAARECAAGRYFSGEECLRGAISENFFFVFQSGIAVPYGDGAYFSVRERGQRCVRIFPSISQY